MGNEMTRRSFLAGTGMLGAVGAVGALGLAGCAPSQPTPTADTGSAESAPEKTDWLGSAPEIAPEDCASTVETDVLVIGAGPAGSMAAYGAVQEGASVLLVDKHSTFHFGGGCVSFVNSNYQKENGVPEMDETALAWQLYNECQSRPNMELIMSWAKNSGAILDELMENVVTPAGVPAIIKHEAFDPSEQMQANWDTGISFNDLNNDSLKLFVQAVQDYVAAHGAEIRYNTKGECLTTDDDGNVTGAILTDEAGEKVLVKASKGVMVCTGSFGSDAAMVEEFYSPGIARLFSESNIYNSYYEADGAPTEAIDTGDGHKMMCWVGAQMEERTHGYCGWPLGGALGSPYLAVDQYGHRFMNETTYMLNSLPQFLETPHDKGSYTWQIISSEDAAMPNVAGVPDGVLQMFIENGESFTADTLEDLAAQIDVDPDEFVSTVERYNELCEAADDVDYGKKAEFLIPVKTAPFTAVRVIYGVAVTLGGVKTNGNMQVLDASATPIKGLYAVGNTAGRRFGWAYQNRHNAMTNSFSVVHGYLAGHHCAAQA